LSPGERRIFIEWIDLGARWDTPDGSPSETSPGANR
jgi:hypothetical protein